jgi:two-component system, NtrC family, response regulator GlrR
MTRANVLLVDDDAGMLQLLAMRLGALNYSTQCASSGADALVCIRKRLPDVVITDLRMEEMNGMALFEKIHSDWPSLPVIILTAHGSIREAVEATQKGVFSFLTKPVDKDELLSILSEAVANQSETPKDKQSWAEAFNTCSAKMYQLLEQAHLLAASDVNVLISGESGTGKEVLARTLHQQSSRANRPFVAINCSAIPAEMLESELFGHVKGSFTGATRDHEGLFVAAEGGVVFLDEVGDMPLPLQAKLLRVLQEKVVRPVGGVKDRPINVRILSATHRNLVDTIEQQQFREDLFYRLNVVNLVLPSLRERKEDIPLLAQHFLNSIAQRTQMPMKFLAPKAMNALLAYSWPGNIRQLENVIEQVIALCPGPIIPETLIENALPNGAPLKTPSLTDAKKAFERKYVEDLLRTTAGSITEAAKLAGRNRSDFYKIVQRHKVDNRYFKPDS